MATVTGYTKDGADAQFIPQTAKGAASGVASLDATGKLTSGQLPDLSGTYININKEGVSNGVATLDSGGHVPITQLPTSVADYGRAYLGFSGDGIYTEKAQFLFSPDGHRVTASSNNPVFTDAHTGTSFRDPSLLKIGSTWFCAYTVDNGYLKNFAVISSVDFVNWSTVATVDVSAATSINQAWAPELVTDGTNVYAFFTNVTSGGAQSFWYVRATDSTGLTTWTTPSALTWATSPGNCWDCTFTYNANAGLWYMFYAYSGYIQRAYSTSLTGTWTTDETGDWAGWISGLGGSPWQLEAPEVIQESSSLWRIYFDPYQVGPPAVHPGYYWSESTDFVHWTTPVLVSRPPGAAPGLVLRHGAWVRLANDTDRNLALAAVSGGIPLPPHAEFSGTFSSLATGVVTNAGAPALTVNTNNDKFITCSGSGIFVPAVTGIYDLSAVFNASSSSGVTRTFAQLTDAQNSDAVLFRQAGATEVPWQLEINGMVLTGGHQYRIQIYQASSGAMSATETIAWTYRGRAQ